MVYLPITARVCILRDRCVKIEVGGVVQGVGFRPYVARLASKLLLNGFVQNSSSGAIITICGDSLRVEEFLAVFQSSPPPLAKIDSVLIKESEYQNFDGFFVKESSDESAKTAFFPPDLTICEECEKELFDANDRRYLYPLINCQNCGPRFTVIDSLPYDRMRTSMRPFEMCPSCKNEYEDISDRRFHAEPVSCPSCGPSFYFTDDSGVVIASSKNGDILSLIADALRSGKIVAIKGVGGFHLVCRADSDEAVRRLRDKKQRAKKPFAVMFKNLDALRCECSPTKREEELLASKERPITLMRKSHNYSLSSSISFESPFIGAFLPYSGVYATLFGMIDFALVATSANISDEPIATSEEELFLRLASGFDYAFYYDRKILQGCDDSVVRASDETIIKLRNSRGFAPLFFKSDHVFKEGVFCAGAHQKNSFAICFGQNIVVSAHIGDLDSLEAVEYYEKSVERLRSLWGARFGLVVRDLNARYASSRFADSIGAPILTLQHHKAHFLASLLERRALHSDALGVVWDGTGIGEDGNVWGGEFFVKSGHEITREAHLPYFWLLGGERAAKEPRKSAFSLALSFLTQEEMKQIGVRLGYTENEIALLCEAFDKKLNCVKCSSMGRLFDAIAALIGVVGAQSFDGESGLMLEALYERENAYFYDIFEGKKPNIAALLRLVLQEEGQKAAATKFINTLAEYIKVVAANYDLPIFCSGGVFQNAALVFAAKRALGADKLFFCEKLSPNDSSICVGQAAFAIIAQKDKDEKKF